MVAAKSKSAAHARPRWQRVLPDMLGCAIALALAWALGWRTGDLIWSMWLASLVIGYSLIVWNLFSPVILIAGQRHAIAEHLETAPGKTAAGLGVLLFGKLFLLAFFTIHFGGFHWGHSIFVNSFYPIAPGTASEFSPTPADYWMVLKAYGWFLPLAFLAQRALFKWPDAREASASDAARMRARDEGQALSTNQSLRAQRRPKSANSQDMGAAYKGVVKLHLLIFFLFAADALNLPEFFSYSVVYVVFFFPWQDVLNTRTGRKAAQS